MPDVPGGPESPLFDRSLRPKLHFSYIRPRVWCFKLKPYSTPRPFPPATPRQTPVLPRGALALPLVFPLHALTRTETPPSGTFSSTRSAMDSGNALSLFNLELTHACGD